MRLVLTLVAAILLMSVGAAQAAPRNDGGGEAELARALKGRMPGKPVDCLEQRDIRSTQIIDRTAIIYDTGRALYVNRPTSGADFLNRSDVLVTDTHSSRLCSIDIVRLYDQGSRMQSGSLGLGEFVPYTKSESRH
ncbi:MAG: hypothetical protein JWL66_1665 [Sphingomonadales bacterium]|nr:hypothetical protein [Sphingomonadales bacterium]